MRGEPTLNPDILENVLAIRETAPKFQVSLFTNGVRFFREPELIGKLLDAGVNILCIDCYNNTYDRFQTLAETTGETVVDFRKFSAYKRHSSGHRLRVVNLVSDIQEGLVDVRKIHNNAGNVKESYLESLPGYKKVKLPLKKKCARPFRELVVQYDGRVSICCHDWRSQCIMGNVFDSTLEEIWYGEKHWKILCDLYHKNRSGVPCNKCDYSGGYRLGFLQDPTKKPR